MYKQPNTDEEKLNDLANAFLIDTDVEDLPPDQQAQARNVTASIFVIQQDDEEVRFDLSPANSTGSSGEPGGGGAVTPPGGDQTITFPYKTTEQGDIDDFVQLSDTGLLDGNRTDSPQRLNVHATNASLGNATSYLVPPRGLTIISDIDDILRVTKTWNLKEMMFTTFAKRFEPWGNMPQIYANWSRALPDAHFHYLTTTPEQVTRTYMDFIYRTYPRGSFDTRPFNFSDVSAILSIRRFLLDKIFLTFPERRFVLVGDVSNSDTMKAYPALAQDYPGQVACIFMRNTTATDDSDHFPYNTKGFEGLNQQSYMFFNVPVSADALRLTFLVPCGDVVVLMLSYFFFPYRMISRTSTSKVVAASTRPCGRTFSLSIKTCRSWTMIRPHPTSRRVAWRRFWSLYC